MASVLPFDELNRFNTQVRETFQTGLPQQKQVYEDIIDELLDLLLLAYAQGREVTLDNLAAIPAQGAKKTAKANPSLDDVMKVVNAKVAGKTWEERVREWVDKGGTADDIVRIAETETHRVANTSALTTAKETGASMKTWATMLDDRVRETHDYLEGVTVGIDDEFITYDGDSASAPGLFSLPENNINCRCELIFS